MSFSILVVGDEPDVLHFSDEEALQQLAHGIEPQLIVILSDINMPGMDGLTLLREIKRRRPDLPVMMVTAYGDDDRRRDAAEAGALQFLTKPVNFRSSQRRAEPEDAGDITQVREIPSLLGPHFTRAQPKIAL